MAVLIESDFRMIKSAYFTEPADQSCWWYLRWLVDFASKHCPCGDDELALAKRELANIEELLSIEPEAPCKIF